jgi:hypothetical protein
MIDDESTRNGRLAHFIVVGGSTIEDIVLRLDPITNNYVEMLVPTSGLVP